MADVRIVLEEVTGDDAEGEPLLKSKPVHVYGSVSEPKTEVGRVFIGGGKTIRFRVVFSDCNIFMGSLPNLTEIVSQ